MDRAQVVASAPAENGAPAEAAVDRWAAALTLPTLYEERAELQRQRASHVGRIADVERTWRTIAVAALTVLVFAVGLLVVLEGVGIAAGAGIVAILALGAVARIQLPAFVASLTETSRRERDRIEGELVRVDATIAKAQHTVNS